MSNIDLIIAERAANIGSFLVGRLLPFRQKRAVGPFVFIDHMGPTEVGPDQAFDIGPHPHIGLSTLTFLFEGAIMHRDSTGAVQEIQPGAVNWMTAGKGVTHSERTPDRLRGKTFKMHGLQIWVALPPHLEETEPSFAHIPAEAIPAWETNGVKYKLIAGKALGHQSPVPVHIDLYFIEIHATETQVIGIGAGLYGESALYILNGEVNHDGQSFGPKQLLVTTEASLCAFTMQAGTTVYIFGGEPMAEEHFIHWNFVSSSKEKIQQAVEDWQAQRFPKVPGETDFVPYPGK